MNHIELSISPIEPTVVDPLRSWAAPVVTAEEACLVMDTAARLVQVSVPWTRLLHTEHPTVLAGRHLFDEGVLRLIDFTAAGTDLAETEREQAPPLLALTSGRPARGLMRARTATGVLTLDAIATPLWHGRHPVGVLAFFEVV